MAAAHIGGCYLPRHVGMKMKISSLRKSVILWSFSGYFETKIKLAGPPGGALGEAAVRAGSSPKRGSDPPGWAEAVAPLHIGTKVRFLGLSGSSFISEIGWF